MLTAIGTYVFLLVPSSVADTQSRVAGYIAFIATLVGFIFTIIQLEREIQQSREKPTLNLEILPYTGPNSYASEKCDKLAFYPLSQNRSRLGAKCALRITNTGDRAASRIYLTFDFRRQQRVKNEPTSKVNVIYEEESVFSKDLLVYADAYQRYGYMPGWTFKYSDNLAIHTDHFDRPIVAEITLMIDNNDFESEYEIHYRLQSYEGNNNPDKKRKDSTSPLSRIYPIKFVKGEED